MPSKSVLKISARKRASSTGAVTASPSEIVVIATKEVEIPVKVESPPSEKEKVKKIAPFNNMRDNQKFSDILSILNEKGFTLIDTLAAEDNDNITVYFVKAYDTNGIPFYVSMHDVVGFISDSKNKIVKKTDKASDSFSASDLTDASTGIASTMSVCEGAYCATIRKNDGSMNQQFFEEKNRICDEKLRDAKVYENNIEKRKVPVKYAIYTMADIKYDYKSVVDNNKKQYKVNSEAFYNNINKFYKETREKAIDFSTLIALLNKNKDDLISILNKKIGNTKDKMDLYEYHKKLTELHNYLNDFVCKRDKIDGIYKEVLDINNSIYEIFAGLK